MSVLGTSGVPARVVAAHTLHCLKHRLVEDCRHRDGDPLIARALHLPALARLTIPRHGFGSIVVSLADVGFILQDAPYGRHVPEVPPHWRANAVAVQPDDDLTHRYVLANTIIENAAHDGGLRLEHLQMRRALAGPGIRRYS